MEKVRKILVIDDDLDIGLMLQMMLEYKGYEVTVISKADETWEILRNDSYDLIVLDMLISGVNGTDVCRRLKVENDISQLPVLMISALSDAEPECLEAGADDFISKPFEMQAILSKIDKLVNADYKAV